MAKKLALLLAFAILVAVYLLYASTQNYVNVLFASWLEGKPRAWSK